MNTATRNDVVRFYSAVLALVPSDERGAFKAHVDALINVAADGVTSRPRFVVAAEVLVRQAAIVLGETETKITDESWELGAFLTGGHTFHRYGAARRFVARYFPEAADELVDVAY